MSTRLLRTACLAISLIAAASAAPAQEAAAPAAAIRPPLVPVFAPDADLLQAFGGVPGIQHLSNDFVDRLRADPRIGHFFAKTKLSELKKQLGDQLCQVLAGPCVYEGDSMRASHGELGITRADSLALVEVLQTTMDDQGIPFRDQNKLLARLAPMFRDIITR